MEQQQLWDACSDGNIEEVIKLLQNSQININWQNQNYFGRTPFYIACQNGHIEIVKLLLSDNRIDINKTNDGYTPFHMACLNGKTKVVKYLLESEREIDINKKDNDGKSGLDYAKQKGNTDIVKLIESFQKNPSETRAQLRREFGNFFHDSLYFCFNLIKIFVNFLYFLLFFHFKIKITKFLFFHWKFVYYFFFFLN